MKFSFFSRNNQSKAEKATTKPQSRRLALEPLEIRDLLAVSVAEFNQIRAAYPDLGLSSDISDYNVIEITASQLSVANLRNAISTARTTQKPDLIVARTTAATNTITYASWSDEILINIDATTRGRVTIVGFGDKPLTIDAAGNCRVLNLTSSTVALANLIITDGYASHGGGIYNNGGTLMVTDSTISGNTATSGYSSSGGGIYNENGMLTITNSTISGNSSSGYVYASGGGIANGDSTLMVTNCTISGNTASSSLPYSSSSSGGYGGGIYNIGGCIVTVTESTITGNSASSASSHASYGGGIYNVYGMVIVTESIISENTAYSGGGINNSDLHSSVTVTNSTVIGNTAERGGGIFNASTLTVTNSTVSGNTAERGTGGGIANENGMLTITNSALSGNVAYVGGGIDNRQGTLTVTNSTISGNSATGTGGGIYSYGTTTLYNTIVAKNSTDMHRTGGTPSGSNNLIGDGTNSGLTNGVDGNIVGTAQNPLDPLFVNISSVINENNTGINYNPADWDLRLQAGSPALDMGNNTFAQYPDNSTILYDLDGKNRIINGVVDIRAYEYGVGVIKLAKPVLGTVNVTSATEIALTWSAVANAIGYTVQYATNSTFSTGVLSKDFATGMTSGTLTGLTANTTYYVRILAKGDGATYVSSDYSAVKNATTPQIKLTAPVLGTVNAINATDISVSWSAVSNNAGYTVQYATNAAFSTGVQTKDFATGTISGTLTGLFPGMTYYIRVLAKGNGTAYSDSDYSVSKTATTQLTKLSTPTLGVVIATSATEIALIWNVVSNASGYTVQYATDLTFTSGVGTQEFGSGITSWTLTDMMPGMTYYVRILAQGNGAAYSDSDYSTSKKVTTQIKLAIPTLDTVIETGHSAILLNWAAIFNASGYTIQYATNAAFSAGWYFDVPSGTTSATLTGLSADTTYYVRLMAKGDDVSYTDSNYSASKSATTQYNVTKLDSPTLNSVSATSSSEISVTWSTVPNATGYIVEYATNSAFTTGTGIVDIDSGLATETKITGLVGNTIWYVRVIAKGDGTNFNDSDVSGTENVLTYPGVPTNLRSTAQTTRSVTVAWNAPTGGAVSYLLEWSADGSTGWTQIGGTLTATSYTHTSLTLNTLYYYRVTAVNTKGNSATSTVFSVKTSDLTKLGTPTLGTVSATSSSEISVAWTAVANASGYTVQYATNSAFTSGVGIQDFVAGTTSGMLSGLSANTTYYVRVLAKGDGIDYSDSNYSTSKNVTTQRITLSAPTLGTVNAISATEMTVSWGAVSNASGYTIQYATNAAFTSAQTATIGSGSTTLTTLTGLTANTTYYVRIMATGTGNYSNSDYSTSKTLTTPQIKLNSPVLGTVSATSATDISLAWNVVSNASGYTVQYTTDSTFNTGVQTKDFATGTISGTLTSLSANTTYYVRILAKGNGTAYSDSDYSVSKNATTPQIKLAAPVLGTVIETGSSSIVMSWTAVLNASGYTIQYATNAAFTGALTKSVMGDSTSTDLTGLVAETTYYVRIFANGNGAAYSDSDYSASKTATTQYIVTKLTSPTLGAVTATSATEISVAWTAVPNATGYVLEYATNAGFTTGTGMINLASGSTTSASITGLAAHTTYYVRILAKGNGMKYNDSGYSDSKNATTPQIKLNFPVLGTVSMVSASEISVTWAAVSNASGYTVQYTTDSTFSTGVQSKDFATGTTNGMLSGLSAVTTYYVRILAKGNNGAYTNSDYSVSKSATTDQITLQTPTLGTVQAISHNVIGVMWTAVPHANGYIIEYATNATFTAGFGMVLIDSALQTTANITGLAAETTYFVRMVAKGDGITYRDSVSSTVKNTTTPLIEPEFSVTSSVIFTETGSGNTLNWLNEWSFFSVEIWVSTLEGGWLTSFADATFQYNAGRFMVSDVIFSPEFTGIVQQEEGIVTISATCNENSLGTLAPAMLARINFKPVTVQANGTASVQGMVTASEEVNIQTAGLQFIGEGMTISGQSGTGEVVGTMVEMSVTDLAVQSVPYDFNGDGRINASDFLAFAKSYGKQDVGGTGFAIYDFNDDGKVNAADFLMFAKSYGKSSTTGLSNSLLPKTGVSQGLAAEQHSASFETETDMQTEADTRYAVSRLNYSYVVSAPEWDGLETIERTFAEREILGLTGRVVDPPSVVAEVFEEWEQNDWWGEVNGRTETEEADWLSGKGLRADLLETV